MDHDEFLKQSKRIRCLYERAAAGDNTALDELYSLSALKLVFSYMKPRSNQGRKTDHKKVRVTAEWAIKAAQLQIEDTGKINPRTLTSDTLYLASIDGVELAERTTRQIIKKHFDYLMGEMKK